MSGTAPPIDLRPDHWIIVRDVLRLHIPDRKVLAFGSRATWTAKEYSDLDLAILGDEALPLSTTSTLAESFGKSDLPFKVDLVDWMSIDEAFQDIIRRDGVAVQAPTERSIRTHTTRGSLPERREPEMIDNTKDSATKLGWLFHPPFPAHWQACSLYSMATWVNGIAFRNIQFSEIGRPVIKIAEIKNGISRQTKFTQKIFDDSVLVRPGDLLFSWSGQPETSIDAFWWRGPEGWLNQHVFKVNTRGGVFVDFFYYLLRYLKPNFVEIARNKQTTGLGHVTKRDLESIEVAYPDLIEQRAIARILGALDDKIEMNRRMNETLEETVQAVFKDWFIDFGPVWAKIEGRASYLPMGLWDLFPDRLDAEGRPTGWSNYELGELVRHHRSTVTPGTEPKRIFEHYSIPAHDAGCEPALDFGNSIKSAKVIVPEGAILLSKLNPSIERVWWPNQRDEMLQIASTEFLTFTALLPATRSVLYCLFRSQGFRDAMAAMVTGTSKSHQRVSPKALLAEEVLVGEPRLLDAFDRIISPVFQKMLSGRSEIHNLSEARNLLLPRLISGEVRLVEAERATETVL